MIRLPAALCFRRGGAAGLAPVLSRGLAEDVAIRRKDRSKNYKFVDKVAIEVSGGKGGNGCVSFETLGPGRKRPDGGNGGKGGDVYVIADKSMTSFTMKTFHFNGGPGAHGSSAGLTGRRGKDVVITVPCGTLISERVHEEPNYGPFNPFDDECADSEEGDEDEVEGTSSEGQEEPDDDYEDEDDEEEGDDDDEGGGERLDAPVPRVVAVSEILLASQLEAASRSMDGPDPTESLSARELFNHNRKKQRYNRRRRAQEDQQGEEEEPEEGVVIDMDVPGVPIRLAEGGRPGVGTQSMGGTGLRRAMSVPKTKMPGRMGDRRSLMFELKLIADVGLVGFPNAGKSSLLKALSNAQPKIAAYAFTTLHPNIGVVEYSDTGRITMADIPGLIEGAHDNRGLGHDFLRHIVRTQALLYVIDGAGTEGREPAADLHCLVEELRQYDSTLLEKPSFVFCNKAEINGTKVRRRRLADAAASYGMLLLEGSALKGIGLGPVADELRRKVEANRRVLHPEK